jgi:hypothetical protein
MSAHAHVPLTPTALLFIIAGAVSSACGSHAVHTQRERFRGFFCNAKSDSIAFLTHQAQGENEEIAANSVNKNLAKFSCAYYLPADAIYTGDHTVIDRRCGLQAAELHVPAGESGALDRVGYRLASAIGSSGARCLKRSRRDYLNVEDRLSARVDLPAHPCRSMPEASRGSSPKGPSRPRARRHRRQIPSARRRTSTSRCA